MPKILKPLYRSCSWPQKYLILKFSRLYAILGIFRKIQETQDMHSQLKDQNVTQNTNLQNLLHKIDNTFLHKIQSSQKLFTKYKNNYGCDYVSEITKVAQNTVSPF